MNFGEWSFYDADGRLRDKVFRGDQRKLAANTPAGCTAISGRFDPHRQRVDVKTAKVVDWDEGRARREAEDRSFAARHAIEDFERKQLRAIRELTLDPNNAEAKKRLAEIDAEIAALRVNVTRIATP